MVNLQRRKRVRKILRRFFKNTTIHACNFFTMDHLSIYEKIFWALVNIITITLTIFWIQYLWLWYVTDSTFVNFDGTIPISEVEHPGVAICNINKISKRRAYKFATELSPLLNEKNITAIMEDIRLIGNLYDSNMYDQARFLKVQEMLDKYDNFSDFYDPTARIVQLTTSCNEILHKCRWNGKEYPCGELFLTRMTFDGLCCAFNYVKPLKRAHLYKDRNIQKTQTNPKMCHGPGRRHGLEIELNNDLDDYFYTTVESKGFKVHFFLCRDFPDVLSGSLQEFLVGVGREIHFNIEIDVIQSMPQIKSIPIPMRKCKFASESNTSFGLYGQSDCLVECKLRSMQALCNCIPFVMPIEAKSSSKYRTVCTLIDIPCTSQYVRKWARYFPKRAEIKSLDLEQHDSLKCDCLPTCDSVNYNIYTNMVPVAGENRNMSKISIFFVKSFASLYKIDMTFTWFELISAYGGFMSLVMGLSLISIIEVFVLLYKLMLYYIRSFLN